MNDNLSKYLNFRQESWKLRLKREEYLEEVVDNILSRNDLKSYTELAQASGLDVEAFDTCVALNWKQEYPYVYGDDKYDEDDENEWQKFSCRLFVTILGSYPDEFKPHISYEVNNSNTTLKEKQSFARKDFDKKLSIAPKWFKDEVERISRK